MLKEKKFFNRLIKIKIYILVYEMICERTMRTCVSYNTEVLCCTSIDDVKAKKDVFDDVQNFCDLMNSIEV